MAKTTKNNYQDDKGKFEMLWEMFLSSPAPIFYSELDVKFITVLGVNDCWKIYINAMGC